MLQHKLLKVRQHVMPTNGFAACEVVSGARTHDVINGAATRDTTSGASTWCLLVVQQHIMQLVML